MLRNREPIGIDWSRLIQVDQISMDRTTSFSCMVRTAIDRLDTSFVNDR